MATVKEKRALSPNEWKLQDAKAKFSEVFERAKVAGPQRITRHGKDTMVLIPLADYLNLTRRKKPEGDLFDFFSQSPLVGSGIDLEHKPDFGRDIDL